MRVIAWFEHLISMHILTSLSPFGATKGLNQGVGWFVTSSRTPCSTNYLLTFFLSAKRILRSLCATGCTFLWICKVTSWFLNFPIFPLKITEIIGYLLLHNKVVLYHFYPFLKFVINFWRWANCFSLCDILCVCHVGNIEKYKIYKAQRRKVNKIKFTYLRILLDASG